jgi:hypothetical protein
MSQNLDWTLLSFQSLDCRLLESILAYSGPFAPDFAPGFAPDLYSRCRIALQDFSCGGLRQPHRFESGL